MFPEVRVQPNLPSDYVVGFNEHGRAILCLYHPSNEIIHGSSVDYDNVYLWHVSSEVDRVTAIRSMWEDTDFIHTAEA